MSHKTRCLNIDWLEVYVLEAVDLYPCNADYFRSHGYFVHERDYGTRVFREMFILEDEHNEKWLEIRREPASQNLVNKGILPREACHIRLTNRACYESDCIDKLRRFLAKHRYEFKRIFRIDLCLDFEVFDSGDIPARFMRRYMEGKYSKIRQAHISAHGTDSWQGRVWNSVSWGSPASMVSTKFYCKSLELQDVKTKPYITYAWFLAGLITDPFTLERRDEKGALYKPVIWRLEFSLHSSVRGIFVLNKNATAKAEKAYPNTLSVYDTPQRRLLVFASLVENYFHFKYYDETKRKDRCKDKVLFKFGLSDVILKIDALCTSKRQDSIFDRLLKYLTTYQNYFVRPETIKAIDIIIDYIRERMISNVLPYDYTYAERRAMQVLIEERLKGLVDQPTADRLRELINIFSGDDAPF